MGQTEFAASLGQQSESDVWSFGQIIAVVVFLPVLNELLYQYLDKPHPASASIQQHASACLSNIAEYIITKTSHGALLNSMSCR